LKNHCARKIEIYVKVLGIQVCKNHGPMGSSEAIIGETVFTCVYIGKTISKIFFCRTTAPEKLKFTRKPYDIVRNKLVKIMALGGWVGPQ
jgi:hypothetical protein